MRSFLASAALCAAALITPMSAQAGFTVKLFADPVDTGSDVTFGASIGSFQSDAISFESNNVTSSDAAWPLATERFGAEVTGLLRVASDGDYSVSLGSDDGAYLFLNGALAIARPGDQGYAVSTQTLALLSGDTPFRIAYYNGPCCGTGLTLTAGDGVTIAAVPEPATYALMAGGLVIIGTAVRSRRRRWTSA
ncbi:MAG: PA14 domain-containing protein [Burkholderiales bacterium]